MAHCFLLQKKYGEWKIMENYKYKVDVEMTRKDLYDYMMHRTYTNAGIIFPLIFAAMALWQAYTSYGTVPFSHTVFYSAIGLVFLFGIPVNVYFRSGRMMTASSPSGGVVQRMRMACTGAAGRIVMQPLASSPHA